MSKCDVIIFIKQVCILNNKTCTNTSLTKISFKKEKRGKKENKKKTRPVLAQFYKNNQLNTTRLVLDSFFKKPGGWMDGWVRKPF